MKTELEEKCYRDWRRREAHMVPMTIEGMQAANNRYEEFKKGWEYGVRFMLYQIEQEHKQNKKLHNFYLLLANKIRGIVK